MTTHSVTATTGVQDAGITDLAMTGLDLAGSMSGLAWLRPSAIGRNHTLLSKWNTTGPDYSYLFRVNTSNQMEFNYSDDGSTIRTAASAAITGFAISKWFSLGFKFISGTPAVQFYLAGFPFGSPVAIAGPGTVFNSGADFRIGNFHNGVAADNFLGHLDQVKLYSDERTDAEIKGEIYDDPVSGNNLVAGYTLNNVWTDVSGNSNTLVNNGLSFVEGEIHGIDVHEIVVVNGGIAGSVTLGPSHQMDLFAVGESSGAGGAGLLYRMRGWVSGTGYVFWESNEVDSDASDYTGGGTPTDIIVHKKLGTV